MTNTSSSAFTHDDLEAQHTAELPARDLMISVSLLGIPLAGVDGIAVNVDTSGPNWLFGGI